MIKVLPSRFPSACSSGFHFGMSFNYPLNDEGKAAWFDFIIDDFEDYIENYWSFTKGIDCEEDYPISFQIDYVDNQFLDDFIIEDSFRCELGDECYFDQSLSDTFLIKNKSYSLDCAANVSSSRRIVDSTSSLIEIKMMSLWSQRYLSKHSYEIVVFNSFAREANIPLDDIIKGSLATSNA